MTTRGLLLNVQQNKNPVVTHTLLTTLRCSLYKQRPGWVVIWCSEVLAADVLTLVNEPSALPNLSL